MTAPLRHPLNGHAIDTDKLAENFAGYCEIRSGYVADGTLPMQLAADELQAIAKLTGLSRRKGWDFVQAIMSVAFAHVEVAHRAPPGEYSPPEDDELSEACEQEIMLRAADLVRQYELDDSRDRWRLTGEAPPVPEIAPTPAKPYRTPRATVDAFLWLAGQDDADGLARWIESHKRDAPFLLKLWKARQC